MPTINDVHQQFAEYFKEPGLKGFLYQLSLKMSEGHICIPVQDIHQEEIPENYKISKNALTSLINNPLVSSKGEYKPFVLHKEKFYLQRYFNYETIVLDKIIELTQSSQKEFDNRAALAKGLMPVIRHLFTEDSSKGTDWQKVAALVALLQNFTIITGGPGTGKTTTVAKILTLFFHIRPSMKVALTAPTGKAAARMAESLLNTNIDTAAPEIKASFGKLKPSTIHRLLGWQAGSPYFKHDKKNPLPYDLIVVDESSMIDMALFAKLLQAIGPNTKIILLGDKDQLASVEAGSLFGDLCNAILPLNVFGAAYFTYLNEFISSKETQLVANNNAAIEAHPLFQHIIQLQYSHRFKGDEAIGILSKAILQNNTAIIETFFNHKDSHDVLIDEIHDEQVFENFISGYKTIIHTDQQYSETTIIQALGNLNKLRILCAVKDGPQGVYQINKKVEAYLRKQLGLQTQETFYENRPIMVTKNNYNLGLYNGDIGILKKDAAGTMKAWFLQNDEGGKTILKSVLPGFITEMETVFAMTIHKSQGSEFSKILLILPQRGNLQTLTRELIYTAITRAKEKVVIQCAKDVFLTAVQHQVERGSGIIDRLR